MLATLRRPASTAPGWRWALAGGVTVVALAVTVRTVLAGGDAGCEFVDGQSYCAAARGDPAAVPFDRRPLMPFLVRLIHPGGVVAGFRLWSLISLAVLIVGVYLLTRRLARATGAGAAATSSAVTAAGLTLLMPHAIRLAWVYPVMTDLTAMALGVVWVLVLSGRRPMVAPALAFVCVLSREQWVLPVLVVAVWLVRRHVVNALLHAGAAVAGGLVDVLQPHSAVVYTTDLRAALRHLVHIDGIWSATVVLVIVCLYLAARPLPFRPQPLEMLLILVGGSQAVLGFFSGDDIPRLLAGALPFLLALALGWSRGTADDVLRLLAATVVLAFLWRVGELPSPTDYSSLFRPYDLVAVTRPRLDLDIAVAVAAGLLILASRAVTMRRARSLPA